MSEPDTDRPSVPDFELLRPIGSGGFGEVWLAKNRTTQRLCAVKLIPLHSNKGERASREISSIARLETNARCRHPNLLQIHHVGKTSQYLFYVMDPADDVSSSAASDADEYRPATLQEKLAAGPLPPELCCDYARQLLEGLAMLHAAGMVHRDVKPSNCLFVGGLLKVADFGLLTEAHPLVSRVGTQKYMPPDGRMDMRADVYAAGLVIYEMLSGMPVDEFPRLGPQTQQVRDDSRLAGLLRLALHACERNAEDRPPDARAMLAELATTEEVRRSSRRWWGVAAAAIVVAVVAAWIGIGWRSTPTVDVSFVTDPFEATIYIDGELLRPGPGMAPYKTPCTVSGLAARRCRVAFVHDGRRWEGEQSPYDLSQTQQIVSRRH